MRERVVSCVLTPREACGLLRLGGLQASGGAPLADLAAPNGLPEGDLPADLAGVLSDAGWLDSTAPPRLRVESDRAVRILAAPHRHLHFVLGAAEGLDAVDLYNDADSTEGWVRVAREGGGASVEFFLGATSLMERVATAMELDGTFTRPRLSVRWPLERLLVLLCLLDAFRASSLRAILERGAPAPFTVDAETLLSFFKQGLSRVHYYWGVSLGTILLPCPMNITHARLEAVLEDLAREGFLSRTTHGTFRPKRALLEFCVSLLLVPSFLSVSLRWLRGAQSLPGAHLAAIRGANTLWVLEFYSEDGAIFVSIDACRGSELLDLLREVLLTVEPLVELPEPAPKAETPAPQLPEPPPSPLPGAPAGACMHCGHPLRGGARFCVSCGRAQENPVCNACGKSLPVGARFCSACGTPQAAPQESHG
ncbi:MAG: zinc ribbon domain-containing protein [Armatimonadetes bacterium]|nr:zinc ribbon domain-containing protein [Armatimonadota bacterium]